MLRGNPQYFAARLIGQRLSEAWGRPVVVDNRISGAGNIGVNIVAKSSPDGYTLLVSITNFSTNPSLYSNLPHDTIKDFAPISRLVFVPLLLVVNPSVSATSVKELIALTKARPGQLNYANSGSGTTAHLAGELFTTEDSGLASVEENRAWQQAIPDSRLLVLPGNSYHVAVTDSEKCAKATLEFIAQSGAR